MDLSNFTESTEITKSSPNTSILENNNIKVDFLLDAEKKDIEKEILNKLAGKVVQEIKIEEKKDEKVGEVKPLPVIATTTSKEVTKAKLVEQFIELQKSQGEVKYSANKLKHMKRDDIIQLIANYSNQILIGETAQKGLENLANAENNENKPVTESAIPGVATPIPQISTEQLDVVANGIFGINMALISILETGSHALKEKTGNVALLESWAERAAQKKEAFLFIFKQIYKDYKNEIDKYLSPVAQYGIIMAQTATETIIINIKKNKEQSKQDCVTH